MLEHSTKFDGEMETFSYEAHDDVAGDEHFPSLDILDVPNLI